MTTWLVIGVAFAALLGVVVFMARRSGRLAAEKAQAETSLKVKDKQIEAALDRPDRSELADRLRDGKF